MCTRNEGHKRFELNLRVILILLLELLLEYVALGDLAGLCDVPGEREGQYVQVQLLELLGVL